MDVQQVVNLLGGLLLTIVGWVARELWGAVQRLKDDIKRIEVALPTNYVQKNEFLENMKEIKDTCRQILNKLDDKADKKSA